MPTPTMDSLYREHRSLMLSVAYRMTGTLAEAEDIVQDVFAGLTDLNWTTVDNPRAYLLRSVTNRSINMLNSSRRKREVYIGPWLPEPIGQSADNDPESHALLTEDMSYALLVLLERLTPDERAAFLLREAFGLSYKEAADAMEKTEANLRKLVSRANAKLGGDRPTDAPNRERSEAWIRTFTRAAETGRFQDLLEFVRVDALLRSDGGGKVRAAVNPIFGFERIVAFFEGIASKGNLVGDWKMVEIGGEPALAFLREGRLIKVYVPAWDEAGRIRELYIMMNPEKLTHILF